MPVTSSTVVSQAQRVLFEGIYTAFQNEADFLSEVEQLEEVDTNFKGRQITLEMSPNPSLAFGNLEGGNLATTGGPDLDDLLVTYVWMNSGIEQTYGAMLNDNKETVVPVLPYTVKSSAKQFSQWMNYYFSNGNGTTRLATSSAAYDAGAPTVFTADGATDTIGATWVVPGQKGWIYDPTGVTKRTAGNSNILTVNTVNGTFFTVTVTIPTSMVAGDIFVPENGAGITTGPKGVPYIVGATGDYFNFDRDTTQQLRSTVVTTNGGINALDLYKTYTQTKQRSGEMGRKTSTKGLTMAYGMTQEAGYYALTVATPQNHVFFTNTERPQVDAGGQNLQFTWFGCPIKNFYQFNGDAVWFLYMDLFKIALLKKVGQLLNMPAGDWMQALDGTDSTYRAARQRWMDWAGDMYSRQPYKMGVNNGLSIGDLPTQKGS